MQKKASFPRILGINLAIILGTGVALRILDKGSQHEVEGLGFIIQFGFAIFAQFFLNTLLGLIVRSEATKQSFWTAALVTLLIGFGTCVGVASSY